MAELRERIQAASDRNTELLAGLHETDSAPQQLYQQINYIKDLDTQLQKSERNVDDLRQKTSAELKDHKKYSESTFRRFAHKASGRKERFAEKAAKEEQEYFEAIQAQKTAEDDLAYARQLKAEAEVQRAEYESQAQRHESLQRDLDDLYNSIFTGYTPGFPDEDAKETNLNAARQNCTNLTSILETERRVVHLLKQIRTKLEIVQAELDKARDLSRADMFGGGSMWSMMKRNSLERAQSIISQIRMLQDQVRSIKPDIGDLGPLNVDAGSIWTDVVFDNIFTDMDMHEKIRNSQIQVSQAIKVLQRQGEEAENREKYVQVDLQRASNALRAAREELQKAREEAFVKVAEGGELRDPRSAGEERDRPIGSPLLPEPHSPLPVGADDVPPSEPPPAYTAR